MGSDSFFNPREMGMSMSYTVLLVEDDPTVRRFVTTCLELENLIVLPAADGIEALEIFCSRLKIDLLLTDVQLETGMSGIEVAERILGHNVGTKVLVMSGYPDREIEAAAKRLPFLRKPFTPAILSMAVREALASENSASSEVSVTKRATG
jgi:CheY-like chemotaxis protein